MIHPSYTELIEAINTNNEDDDTTMSVTAVTHWYLQQASVHVSSLQVRNRW